MKRKTPVRMKYRVDNKKKKTPARDMGVCVVCYTVRTKEHARTIKTKQQFRTNTKREQEMDLKKIPGQGQKFLSFPKRPDRLWGSPRLLLNGYRVLFPQ
jgi:hypothetical protein